MEVILICVSLLLFNLLGGIVSMALHAHEKPGPELALPQKISFRLFMITQIMFIIGIVYFYSLSKAPTNIQIIYLVFTVMMAPLMAKFGSILSGVAYAKKLAKRKKVHLKWVEDNMSEEDKIAREIEKQTKAKDRKIDDFAFVNNYDEDDLQDDEPKTKKRKK